MTSLIEVQRRRLLRHGFIFLFVAVWLGIATAVLPHPRAWRATHLTAFLTCLILVAIGLVWRELKLTTRQRSIALSHNKARPARCSASSVGFLAFRSLMKAVTSEG